MIFYIRYQWCLQKATWLEIDIAVSTSVCGIRNSSALQSSVDLVHFRSTSGLVPFRKIQTITQMIWSIQSIAAIWLRQGAIINKDAIIAMIKACAYAWSHIEVLIKTGFVDNPRALATCKYLRQRHQRWASTWEDLYSGFAYNKGPDQPAHPRSLISAIVIRLSESIMSRLAIIEFSIF